MGTRAQDTAFVMYGARAAVASGLEHVEEQVKAIEQAVVENTGLAFDLAKTLIESACKSILRERGIGFGKHDDLPRLFRMTRQSIQFLPAPLEQEPAVRESLERTLNGLVTAVQGVCELRNGFGFASHGTDRPRPAMDAIHAMLAARAADAIVGFLYGAHRQDVSVPATSKIEYADHENFNEWIDERSPEVQILDFGPYRPSEVLFNLDIEAYRELLSRYEVDDGASAKDEEGQRP